MKRCQIPFRGAWRAGPIVPDLDGDSLEVLHNHHPERFRLSGIDCPEKGQAYGKKAKQFTQPGPILCTIARREESWLRLLLASW